MKSVITGTGAYVPEVVLANQHFENAVFYNEAGLRLDNDAALIVEKFQKITGIYERRYAPQHLHTSDMATLAAQKALADSGADIETLDQVIVAHNFGDIPYHHFQTETVPSLASKVKHKLGIRNPRCIAYDVLFGCAGWIQSLIQSEAYFRAGMAKRVLLIGAETLSRVIDRGDRDSMIFADGAGACILEYMETGEGGAGIIGTCSQSDTMEEVRYITMGKSYNVHNGNGVYMKMKGRKVYEYALTHVPMAIKACIDDCDIDIRQIKKIFIHQANEKMDEEIVQRLFALYGYCRAPQNVMPMNIGWLGNSSVATVPTLYHMVQNGEIPGHIVARGDIIVFASVGAGMNINAICYRV